MERAELSIADQERFSDWPPHQPDVPGGRRLLRARPTPRDLLPAAPDGVPDGSPVGDGSGLSGVAHVQRVHRVRAEEVVRAHDGATNVQKAQRAGLCMTNSSRWKIAQGLKRGATLRGVALDHTERHTHIQQMQEHLKHNSNSNTVRDLFKLNVQLFRGVDRIDHFCVSSSIDN